MCLSDIRQVAAHCNAVRFYCPNIDGASGARMSPSALLVSS